MSIIPIGIIEQIIINMIKNKQYSDLNNCKKIPLLNELINNNKKYYILPMVKKMVLRPDREYPSNLIKVPSTSIRRQKSFMEFGFMSCGLIVDKINIIGKNITKIEIEFNGIFTYHYLSTNIINLKPSLEGIHTCLDLGSAFYIRIYTEHIKYMYIKATHVYPNRCNHCHT